MWFSIKPPSGPLPSVLHDATPLTVVDKQKYLGIIFDHRLNGSSHACVALQSWPWVASHVPVYTV